MNLLTNASNTPLPGVMFGLTHAIDGTVIIREPKILKVGIGLPKGKAVNVWLQNDVIWKVRVGFKSDQAQMFSFKTAAEAEDCYRSKLKDAPVCPYPRKTSFFTFTHPEIQDDGSELFVPDFAAIEAHGPTPTAIDIVSLDDTAFMGAYAMWSTSELQCTGDGITARRVLSLARSEEEKALAKEAQAAGEKYFPIIGACWVSGMCPYSKETTKGDKILPSACKPGADLKFQLAQNIRVGGTAYFHTSGRKSILQIHSSIERIKSLTGGRLAGIPLKMCLRPFKTKHNGQAATHYGVSLEFRAEDIDSLRKNLMEQAFNFRRALAPPTRMIEAPGTEPIGVDGDDDDEPPISAQAMSDEFYAVDDTEPSGEEPKSTAAAATENKTTALSEKLKRQSARTAPAAQSPSAPTQQNTTPREETGGVQQAATAAGTDANPAGSGTPVKSPTPPPAGPGPEDLF